MGAEHAVQTLDKVCNRLNDQYRLYGSWRRVAAVYGNQIPAGTLCAIAHGREPKRADHRAILGLPALAPAPVCLRCGEVHVARRCMSRRERPRLRRAINLVDPASAAATIRAYASADYVAELVTILAEDNQRHE